MKLNRKSFLKTALSIIGLGSIPSNNLIASDDQSDDYYLPVSLFIDGKYNDMSPQVLSELMMVYASSHEFLRKNLEDLIKSGIRDKIISVNDEGDITLYKKFEY